VDITQLLNKKKLMFWIGKMLASIYLKNMRLLITAAILISQFNLFGQEIAKCIEILGTDSIKFYYKSNGILVDKECSDYYRIAKVNHEGYFFDGQSKDYYSFGQLAVDCHYINNQINGKYTAFYSNGQIKETGQFIEGFKVGELKYWHENGQLKKIIVFNEKDYFLKEFYKSNGKQLIVDGNGEYIETDLPPKTTMKGEIKNGKQHGKWTISDQVSGLKTGIEFFENGKFIEGQNIAQVQSFSEKYFDYPNLLIDLTEDLLDESYSKKIDCIRYYTSNKYQMARYNSHYTDLPFYDYLYQNFDPPKFENGYIVGGFTINRSGNLTNISLHSTLPDKSIEDQFITVLNSSEKWEPKTLNGEPIESTELFVFQFFNGTYKILGDSRNSLPPVEYSVQFIKGDDYLINLIESNTKLPNRFLVNGFNLATSISFHIDETGNCIVDNSVFIDRVKVSDDERTLYNALIEMFEKIDYQCKPATYNGNPTMQYFNGVFTIKDGKQKFRLFSNNWVLK
jgi:antitoxin component YwqK of YwqJK toxin-antitoxin module